MRLLCTYLGWRRNDIQRGDAALRTQSGSTQVLLALEPEKLSQINLLTKLDTEIVAILGHMNSLIKQQYTKHREIDTICGIIKDRVGSRQSGKGDHRFAEETQDYVRKQKLLLDDWTKAFLQAAMAQN